MAGTEHFDQAARTWDQVDRRVALAEAVVTAIAVRIPLAKDLAVLDFGCGTGLVTLALAGRVGTMAGVDTSPGMLQELDSKAQAAAIPVQLLPLAADGSGPLGGPYGLIVSSMTLHHVEDVPDLFQRLAKHLIPGGQVALADLDSEDGSFHDASVPIHHRGFSRDRIQAWLRAAGFEDIRIETATITRKEARDYPVFLATARRQVKA